MMSHTSDTIGRSSVQEVDVDACDELRVRLDQNVPAVRFDDIS